MIFNIFIIWLQFNSDKKRTQAWRMDCMSPQTLSDIPHTSCLASVRTNLLRSESHFQPFKAVPSSRKRSVASKAGQNVTTWKKDEKCCEECGTEYCQHLPTGLADNGVAISLISWYRMQKATSTFLRLKQYWRQANKKVPVTTTSLLLCPNTICHCLFNKALLITHVRNISLAKQQQMHSITE